MATTIPASFQKFKENLQITGLQEGTVSTRQTNVRAVVEAGIDVTSSFLGGSYMRSTMIAPLKEADVDIFMVLDNRYYHHYNSQNGGQAGLLDFLKRTLRKSYPDTPDVSRNGQAVSIRFTDFVVDVVPAFRREGGGFLIPNSITQTWLASDPKKHIELISASNSAHNGDLVPLLKMIKAWNKNTGKYFRSFHLEMLALTIFTNVTITDYPSGMRYFFDKGRALIRQKNQDPAGFGDDLGRYINTTEKVEEATGKFQLAYERAVKAEEFASRANVFNAVDMWIKINGGYFPAYG